MLAVHGLDTLQRELGDIVVEAVIPRPGQSSTGTYEGEGHVVLRHPDTAVVEAGVAPRGRGCTRRARREDVVTATVLMISPRLPRRDALLHPRARSRRGHASSVRATNPSRRCRRWRATTSRTTGRSRSFAHEDAILHEVAQRAAGRQASTPSRSLWEPTMVLAARIRERLGIPGMSVEQTIPFRRETMKQVLDAAGIRTPHHYRSSTAAGIREAVERIGYPIIVKPIAGAGSASTFRVDGGDDLERVIPLLRGVAEVSVEEFIDGSEYTYDTICSNGEVLFEQRLWLSAATAASRASSNGSALSPSSCATSTRRISRMVAPWAATSCGRSDFATASRTWNGSSPPPVRWSSERSARARRVRGR